MRIVINETQSVCPRCLRTIDARRVLNNDGRIYMEKNCPEHGSFKVLIWEGDMKSYYKWNNHSGRKEQPVNPDKTVLEGCPKDCGLCDAHETKGCCMLLEVTKRCNLNCPVCFASAGEEGAGDLPLSVIEQQYDHLMTHGGPFNIQLSGGEPTLRDDLDKIIRMGRAKGFTFFQLNTNGLRLAHDMDYLRGLKAAGLNTVFLQFDGLTDDVYETLRGRALFDLKCKAIENCSREGLGVVLVPVIAPGVNDHQVGDILNFAMERMPAVRGVHFQPISYFGRCNQDGRGYRITIPAMLRLIEDQTAGQMTAEDFGGGGAENPYCSFHASYMRRPDGSFHALQKRSTQCCCTGSDDSREFVARQWSGKDEDKSGGCCCGSDDAYTETSALDEFLEQARENTFTVSGMIFQDAFNFDLARIRRCYICEVDPEQGIIPFCAYNLTDEQGNYLYRGKAAEHE